jgi:hypothetical protein
MSTPRKPKSPVTWKTIERVADKAERARLEALSEEDIDRELREAGIDPEEAVKVVERAIDASEGKQVPAPPAAARPRVIEGGAAKTPGSAKTVKAWGGSYGWIAAVAAAAVVLLVLVRGQLGGVSHGAPDMDSGSLVREPTAVERAAMRREEAYAACRTRAWTECQAKLDEARRLDPAGEEDPRVQVARHALYEVSMRDAGREKGR